MRGFHLPSFMNVEISKSRFVAVTILFSNTLAWFYVFHTYLLDLILVTTENNLVYVSIGRLLFYGFAVISGIAGSLISERFDRRRFLVLWILFGVFATLCLVFFQGSELILLSTFFLGITFGMGFPTCQAYLTESTSKKERGRIGGLVIVVTFVIVVAILLLTELLELEIIHIILICLFLKATSLISLVFDPCPCKIKDQKRTSWFSILTSRIFLSYALPWLIFNLANGLTIFGSLPPNIEAIRSSGTVVAFFTTIFAAIVAGFIADRWGRKVPILTGLVLLGSAYALYAIVSTPESFFIQQSLEGVAWGLIAVSYMQVVLGDISEKSGSKEKYFAIGGILIPLLTRTIFSVTQELTQFSIPASTITSFLSIIVLLSIYPVLRATETLSEEDRRKREFEEHIGKVKKVMKEDE